MGESSEEKERGQHRYLGPFAKRSLLPGRLLLLLQHSLTSSRAMNWPPFCKCIKIAQNVIFSIFNIQLSKCDNFILQGLLLLQHSLTSSGAMNWRPASQTSWFCSTSAPTVPYSHPRNPPSTSSKSGLYPSYPLCPNLKLKHTHIP